MNLRELVQKLLDSADQEGCTPDLAVVSSSALVKLSVAVGLGYPDHICSDPEEEEVD